MKSHQTYFRAAAGTIVRRLLPALALTLTLLPASRATAGTTATFVEVALARNIDFVGTTGDTFEGVEGSPGFLQRNMGQGAAVGDYDGDGDLDVYLLGFLDRANVLLRNDLDLGTASFTDVTADAGVGGLGMSRVAHFVDLDNDGDLDLIVLNDNDAAGAYPPSTLYRNDAGVFTDVTTGSGFEPLGYLRMGMSLADYDLDGLLDVYVTVWPMYGPEGPARMLGENRFYRNLGNFTFEDVTDAVGLGGLGRDSFTAIFHDLDEDGRPDIHVAIDHSSDETYLNTGSGFDRVTEDVGTTHTGNDMGANCADLDDDGDLDLYSTNITGPNFGTTQGNCLYVSDLASGGALSFSEQAFTFEIEDTFWGWGVEFIDPDNDGDLDIFAVSGFDEFVITIFGPSHALASTQSVLFTNEGGGTFTRSLVGADDDSRGLIAFDYDRDGDEDLLVTNVNQPVRLYENQTPGQGHWLDVAVEQTRGNRGGIGVTVFATIGGVTKRREILAGESYLAGTPAEAHFGLGAATTVDELRVRWTDGTETVLSNVPADQFIFIGQPELGDLDGSGVVDFVDLTSLLAAWGPCPTAPGACPADLDGDGQVAFPDLTALLANWG
jgi:hypothetical protein